MSSGLPGLWRKLVGRGRSDVESVETVDNPALSSTTPSQGNRVAALNTDITSSSDGAPPALPTKTSSDGIHGIPGRKETDGKDFCNTDIDALRRPGLHILFQSLCIGQPSVVAEIDIVAVHGLNFRGDPDHAWKTWSSDGKLWLRDFLPARLPGPARVMLFAYNSSPAIGAAATRLDDHAKTLLHLLLSERKAMQRRPLIFICHSLGGLVVKEALVGAKLNDEYNSILEATCLLVFFATPHRGGNHASVGDIALKIAKLGRSNNDLLKALKRNSNEATRRVEQGRHIFKACRVISFFEREKYGNMGIIVDETSATLGFPGSQETQVPMPADHSAICKFGSVEDPTCELALRTIAAGIGHIFGSDTIRFDRGVDYALSGEDRSCLRDLQTTDPRLDKKRIEETKGGLLGDAYRWVLNTSEFQQWHNDEQSPLLWIKGDPGKGKTMLLCGIIDELQRTSQNSLLAYFFCQAANSNINSASAVLRGLIFMMITKQPALVTHVRKRYDLAGKQLFENANAWVALKDIFSDILQDQRSRGSCLIIDGLDECSTDLKLLLGLIQSMAPKPTVKWIVSSRNWPNIEQLLNKTTGKLRLCLELNEESVSTAVGVYIRFKVNQLAKEKDYDTETQATIRDYLSSNAHGTFLWVALICQELVEVSSWKVRQKVLTFPPGLDELYMRMFRQVSASEDMELCTQILAVVVTAYRPLTLDELAAFIDLPDGVSPRQYDVLEEIIALCGSFLTLRNRTIFFVHLSAKDFLLNKVQQDLFPSGAQGLHYDIFSRSLQALSKTLKRDIYQLSDPGFPIDQVSNPHPDPLAAVQYSCIFWVDHLKACCETESGERNFSDSIKTKIKNSLQDGGLIDNFLRKHYLHWLEALSLLRSMSQGVLAVAQLVVLFQKQDAQCARLVHDAGRFIQSHKAVMENHPMQIYASALLFSPTGSLIRKQFGAEEPSWIDPKPIMDEQWSACLATLEGHISSVLSVAWSSDGRLASGSHDKTIKIWDAAMG